MRLRSRSLFQTARTEGGLLPADLLQRVADNDGQLDGLKPSDYHLAPGERLNEATTRSWNRLLGAWRSFDEARGQLASGDRGGRLTRERWLHVLFNELGYGRLVQQSAIEIEGKSFPVFSQWQHTPIHLVGCGVKVDTRTPGVAGAAGQSPHSLLQELLNRSPERLWGIVSNGLVLRVLRDNVALTRQAYLEFDLEGMFSGEVYPDFVLLWLVCHQSRVEAERPEDCWLERWTQDAAEHGTRALDALRDGVQEAIEILGAGFLAHPANHELHSALRAGTLEPQDYYRQLLRLVYRLLFLFVAEDRDALLDPAADKIACERYSMHYSTERLRSLAQSRRGGRQHDRYEQLKLVMDALHRDGCAPLGLPALGSYLWSPEAIAGLTGAVIANEHLLDAIRALATVEERGVRRAVDFLNLGAEELGSVYESLLELHPALDRDTAGFALRAVAGSERKTTGSYYTPTILITSLLDSALEPVLDEAAAKEDPNAALLDLKVCDPACGSGHFLIAAANRIAKRLASIRTGDAEPSPEALRSALHDVVGRCIYGVDVNPMAVELCRVALWMEAVEPGRPLTFLEGHIRPGNALLGALPGCVDGGVTDEAFQAIRGDDYGVLDPEDKAHVTKLRKRNADERSRGAGALTLFDPDAATSELAGRARDLATLGDDDLASLRRKEAAYTDLRSSEAFLRLRLAADAWAAAPLAEKRSQRPAVTQRAVHRALDGTLADDIASEIETLRAEYSFFHWHLEFPEVFDAGGFDLVLGNPPWDTLSPDVKEFFAAYNPEVRFQDRDGQRAIVQELLEDDGIAVRWRRYCRQLYAAVHAFKNGGRYRLFASGNLGKGDFNVYRMFVETALAVARNGGFSAQIVPESLVNGANAAAIRAELLAAFRVRLLLTFENTGGVWFRAIHRETKFCMYAAQRGLSTEAFGASFLLRSNEELAAAELAPLRIPVSLVAEFSPDALAIMRFDSQREIDAVSKAYARCPRFGDPSAGEPHRTYMAEIHMGNDRELFTEDLSGLPLYEGRMVWQYDHRAKGYRSGRGRAAVWQPLSFDDAAKSIQPQWRVLPSRVPAKAHDRVQRYRVGFCDVTSPTTERSLVAALIPPGTICGDTVPGFTYPEDHEWAYMSWVACANAFVVDFILRKKVSLHVKYSILDTVPFPRGDREDPIVRQLVPLAARLTCTSAEMLEYWALLAADGWVEPASPGEIPGECDEERRMDLRAKIDALVAADVYGLDRAELEFVLSTFSLAERYETERWGEFRSSRLALEAYDSQAAHPAATVA